MKIEPKLIDDLQNIGLSDKAALVYAAVLELGVAYPSKVSQITKLNRTTVYHILTDLSIKGLITEIERKNKLCYQIEKPDRLIAYTKKQAQLAEDRAVRATKLLPEIQGLFATTPNKPRVRYFEGLDGVLTVFEDHVSEQKPYEMLAYSNVEELVKITPEKFAREYIKKKEKLGVTTRAIFPDTPFGHAYNQDIYGEVSKQTLVQARFIPADQFPYEGEVTMYGKNKVSIINFQKDTLIGVIIEDQMIADMMRMVFELAWKGAKESDE